MIAAPWIQQLRYACAAGFALASLACAGSSAWAQAAAAPDDDKDEYYDSLLNTDRRMMDQLLASFGLVNIQPPIEYRERSPLVIPSNSALPPPGSQVAKNADWPVDPEIKAKRQRAAARKAGKVEIERDPADSIAGTPEMYRTGDTGKWDESGKKVAKDPDFFEMIRSGKLFRQEKDEIGTFKGEPPRASLVEPPPGYLTPSPAAPYGVTDRPVEPPKKGEFD